MRYWLLRISLTRAAWTLPQAKEQCEEACLLLTRLTRA